jgi:hypothetical protein
MGHARSKLKGKAGNTSVFCFIVLLLHLGTWSTFSPLDLPKFPYATKIRLPILAKVQDFRIGQD